MNRAEPVVEEVPLADIVVDEELQSRSTKLDEAQVKRYSIAMKQGDEFPPIHLARINSVLFLIDGFHRVAAANLSGKFEIEAVIEDMSRDEAKWEGGKQNLRHGLPLKAKDKLPMFKAYIKAGGHRKKKGGVFKTYREMAADFHGHLAASTVLKWIRSYYPSIYKAIGQRESKGPGEQPLLDYEELYYQQAVDSLQRVLNLCTALTSPERRYRIIKSIENAAVEMKKLPHVEPLPDDF
jgi:hypothetical protein